VPWIFFHEKQVIHRDLKPSNVLLDADGTPRIADFGLAKLLDQADQTNSEALLGTPSYMAPEQAAGRTKEIGVWTDIYALGAILYEALTGHAPHEAQNKLELMRLVREGQVTPPSRWIEVPAHLEAICLKCLERSPARRYASARALADDLNRWLNDQRPRGIPGKLNRVVRGVWRRKLPLDWRLPRSPWASSSTFATPTGRFVLLNRS